MNLLSIFDDEIVNREYFTKQTASEPLHKINIREFKNIVLQGEIGDNNYIYLKESDVSFFQSSQKVKLNIQNWEKIPLTNLSVFLLSRSGDVHIRTRSSNGTIIIGNSFKGSVEARLINDNSFVVIGDDVTAHGIRLQVHGDGIYIGRRCLISEEVIIQGHDAHAIIDILTNDVINYGDKKTYVGPYVWLGRRVTIMPGAVIGKGSIIGATSTVTKKIEDFSLAVGIPARKIKDNVSWSRTRDELDEKSENALKQIKNLSPENKYFKR